MNSVKFKANINELNKLATRVTSLENSVFPEPGEAPEGAILTINEEGLPEYVPAEDVSVGHAKLADNLDSNVSTEDKVPYIFRTAGGSADIGEREFDTIVGGSVVWNQMISKLPTENENTYAFNSDTQFVSGHKYLFMVYGAIINPQSGVLIANLYHRPVGGSNALIEMKRGFGCSVFNCNFSQQANGNANSEGGIWIYYSNISNNNITSHNVIDLTQMFGSTIADYIYTLEQATAGAGVAWFKKLFPKNYYPYDAGTLKHVEGLTAHKMVGFNQWDEEWEVGIYDTSTYAKVDNANRIRCKNPIRVVPGTTYYVYDGKGIALRVIEYDADMNILNYQFLLNQTFTTNASTQFITFHTGTNDYGTTYGNDICLNLSWDGERDGEYEPYKEMNYPLDESLILRGVPKLDANNALYYDGDVYEADGMVTRRYGIVNLGDLDWTVTGNMFSTIVPGIATPVVPPYTARLTGALCSKYPPDTQYVIDPTSMTDKTWVRSAQGIAIKDTAYSDATAFKTAMSGVYLVYELATPTTEEAEPYEAEQWVDNFGTEEYVTIGIPVGHDTRYPVNLKAKLEMLPNSPDGDGDYIMRQSNGMNAFIPYADVKELPDMPTENGTYVLQAVKTSSGVTLSWVSAT